MNMDLPLQTFLQEGRDLLQEMEESLLALEADRSDSDLINAIFRAAHTIKGSAGLFGLDRIVAFTHVVESALSRVREGRLSLDDELLSLMLESSDHMGSLLDEVVTPEYTADAAIESTLLERLRALLGLEAPAPAAVEPQNEPSTEGTSGNWHLSLRFGPDSFRNGFDPASFLRYLGTLGDLVSVTPILDAMPDAAEFDPETCYMGFEIALASNADKATIESTFDFIREDSLVRILPPQAKVEDYLALIQDLPESDARLGQILVDCGALTRRELEEGLRLQQPQGEDPRPLGTILVEERMVPEPVVEAALERQKDIRQSKERESRSIRVDADKLDHLVNLVGELVIASAGTALAAQQSGATHLVETASLVSRLVEEVRESALRLRMVQIGGTFQRFQRVVRDLSRELGKEIALEIRGGETELDKSVVEKIGDPLTHLVRNAIDHGIEQATVRTAQGKAPGGVLRLDAYHDSGSIVIEVSDDGRGLDRERILAKAHHVGLVAPGATLSDQEVYQLIFEPGFSTAEAVSNLSGRGVGMDVVKRNITALRGSIELLSEPGRGTTVRIRLPLTLAIIDGFLVRVAQSHFVIPLEMVVECVDLEQTEETRLGRKDYVNLRGEVLPLMRLREHFAIVGEEPRRANVVVAHASGHKAGIVVDELVGEFQTVIKPLGAVFHQLRGVSGATILGNGTIALILDVPTLVRQTTLQEPQRVTPLSLR